MSERQLGAPPRALRVAGATDKVIMPLPPYYRFFTEVAA
ncbi:MAG: hypothetical protein JWR83_2184 [Aeromicrobium sp.]|nr:hypothetical protein [Aeromicrobium sp.]